MVISTLLSSIIALLQADFLSKNTIKPKKIIEK